MCAPGCTAASLAGKARAGKHGARCQNPQALFASKDFDHNRFHLTPSRVLIRRFGGSRAGADSSTAGLAPVPGANRRKPVTARHLSGPVPRTWPVADLGLGCLTMTEIVLRVHLISGEYLDVTYDKADGTADESAEHAILSLADDNGILRCRHGDRLVILYGRGVATLEVTPRGAVL